MDALADALELTRALVALETPTGSEGPATDLLAGALARAGYRTVRQQVSPGRDNLLAYRKPPVLVFSTHVDCVPPYVPLSEDAEAIRGRGACDAKGLAAAMVAAAERLAGAGERRIGLLFLVGEENGSDGARVAACPRAARSLPDQRRADREPALDRAEGIAPGGPPCDRPGRALGLSRGGRERHRGAARHHRAASERCRCPRIRCWARPRSTSA